MTVGQALDTVIRAYQPLVAALSTTAALSTSTTMAQGTHTITRETGSFVTDGWAVGDKGYITDSGANNGALFTVTGTVAALTLTVTETLTAQTKAQTVSCVLTRYTNMRLFETLVKETTTTPYLLYTNVIDTDETLYFDCTNTGVARIQFDFIADKAYPSHKTYFYYLRTLLRNTSGSIGGLNVRAILPAGIRERFNSDSQRYVWTAEYEISYSYD